MVVGPTYVHVYCVYIAKVLQCMFIIFPIEVRKSGKARMFLLAWSVFPVAYVLRTPRHDVSVSVRDFQDPVEPGGTKFMNEKYVFSSTSLRTGNETPLIP